MRISIELSLAGIVTALAAPSNGQSDPQASAALGDAIWTC
jgi:hypothetical protein